ncbi:zinc finger protein 287-like [Electrophorus electricus]|uniref:zinc finger protein 287-like n=1 Tax=Electrophorus electricus TaxID=8005 RepID=UPI0015CFCD87|nr:zinc finger protein 287-like [Electrophorus electricus]
MNMGSVLPLSSLRLLVPPLRLMSAFMWQAVQQQKVEHFKKLEEYVQLITKMVPEILTNRQKTTLIMGLRAKMILEMCKHEVSTDLKACVHTPESSNGTTGSEMEALQGKLLKLVLSLLEDPVKKRHFFQEVFPIEYGPDFDKALQVLVGHFLSRLEQLLPVPNFKQVSIWLHTESTDWEDMFQYNWDHNCLMPLFQSDYQGTLERSGLPSIEEDRIISSLSLAPLSAQIFLSESKADEPSLCVGRSCLRNQDVSQESERAAQPLHSFTLNQAEVCSKTADVEEYDSPKCSTDEELNGNLNEKGFKESNFCETKVEIIQASQSEGETLTDRLEERLDPSTVMILNSDTKNINERGDKTADEVTSAHVASTGQLLKVVVPRECLPIVKQICLPSVLLTRCTSNKPIPLRTVPDDLSSNSMINSSISGNGCKHIALSALERRLHECSQCGMSFSYPGELRAHKEKHTVRGPYKCLACKMNFKTHFQASMHQRQWHSEINYSCPSCDKSFNSMRAWTRHRREHQEKTVYRCTDCGKECTSLTSLVIHSKLHNHLMSGSLPSQMYRCTVCATTFSEITNFTSHMKTHQGSSQEACTDLAQGAPPAKRPSGECRFCGQMFSEIELRSHLKTHPEFRPHQCDHCGKCLASLHGLLAHISNHTGDKPHVCVSCGKRFFSQSQLKSHSKERRFCCSYCGKCFLSAGNLNIHVRMHTGEKPYVCTECGKAFKSAGCLQVHRRCHTGEKPYQCTVCGRGFTVSSHRTVHMRAHTGLRPFACNICGKTFVRRSCWNEHLYRHSGIRPFTCSVCSRSFIRRTQLKRHMQSHSGDQSDGVI